MMKDCLQEFEFSVITNAYEFSNAEVHSLKREPDEAKILAGAV